MKRAHKLGAAGKEVTIYGQTDILKEFIPTIEATDDVDLPTREIQVKAHTRKRYPEAPGISVAAMSRTYDPNRGIENGTMPGQNFWLESGSGATKKVRQFNYTGTLTNLRAAISLACTPGTTLRGPTGAHWTYAATTP